MSQFFPTESGTTSAGIPLPFPTASSALPQTIPYAATQLPAFPAQPQSIDTGLRDKTKLLTCYYWYHKGHCTHSNEDCLYSHFLTGKVADQPQQREPGRPAVAGRNATRAQPQYRNWRLYRSQNAAVEPHVALQIENIHRKATRAEWDASSMTPSIPTSAAYPSSGNPSAHNLSPWPAHSAYSTNLESFSDNSRATVPLYPAPNTATTPITPEFPSFLDQLRQAQTSAPSYSQQAPVRSQLQPEHEPISEIMGSTVQELAKNADEMTNHLSYAAEMVHEHCGDAIKAVALLETGQQTAGNMLQAPYAATERCRDAIGHLLQLAKHHLLAMEAAKQRQLQLTKKLQAAGQAGVLPASLLQEAGADVGRAQREESSMQAD